MNVERLLQINIATLAALGTLLLGMGQRSVLLPVLSIVAAVTSVCVTDSLGKFQLNRTVANLAALLAVALSGRELFHGDSEYQLLAVANLLVYLQVILLFQQKNHRLYWQLIMLSLLQVVVASALNLGVEFGVLLVLYMFTALAALCLFFVHREMEQCGSATRVESIFHFRRSAEPFGRERPQRWPLPTADPLRSSGTYKELSHAVLGWNLVRYVLSMGCTTLIFTVILFFAMPRFGNTVWQGAGGEHQPMVGFTQEVALNEMKKLLESPELVMRVNFGEVKTGIPYKLFGTPYWRGTVLWDYAYEGREGKWSQSKLPAWQDDHRLAAPPSHQELVQQDIALEPTQDVLLFSAFPVYADRDAPNQIRFEPRSRKLFRPVENRTGRYGQFRYRTLTTAFARGRQKPIVPHANRLTHRGAQARLDQEKETLLQFDSELHRDLGDLAANILQENNLSQEDVFGRARALESHFINSGLYSYSLDFDLVGQQRDRGLDPIIDFVMNHRTGHCEYFASALTMALRSQGIPARMAVGYKGGEYNVVGDYYQVRQLHAHAWVEAYLEPHEIPPGYLSGNESSPGGAWLRLDPTPGDPNDLADFEDAGLIHHLHQVIDYTQLIWNEYVLGLNSERQKKAIYHPVATRTHGAIKALFDRRWWATLFANLRSGEWFNWQAGLATILFLLVFVGSYRLVSPPIRRVFAWLRDRRSPAKYRARRRVDFYSRLETILKCHGMRRAVGQTPREFAISVGGRMADRPTRRYASSLPRRIVDAFYRVRYGGATLDRQEAQDVENTLHHLKDALSK